MPGRGERAGVGNGVAHSIKVESADKMQMKRGRRESTEWVTDMFVSGCEDGTIKDCWNSWDGRTEM